MSCPCRCHGHFQGACDQSGGCGHYHRNEVDRRCARFDRCAQRQTVDGELVGARIAAERGLCPTCTRIVEDAIAALPRDYLDLNMALARGENGMGEIVAGSSELPVPIRLSIRSIAEAIFEQLVTWVEPVAERLGIDWDSTAAGRRSRPGFVVHRAARIIAPNLSVLLALRDFTVNQWSDDGWDNSEVEQDGVDAALALLRLHHLTHSALGRTKLVHHLPAPCPSVECGAMALVRESGADDVHCERCRRRWTEQDYRRLTLILAADLRMADCA